MYFKAQCLPRVAVNTCRLTPADSASASPKAGGLACRLWRWPPAERCRPAHGVHELFQQRCMPSERLCFNALGIVMSGGPEYRMQLRGRQGGWLAARGIPPPVSCSAKKFCSSRVRRASSVLSFRHASSVQASLWIGSCVPLATTGVALDLRITRTY